MINPEQKLPAVEPGHVSDQKLPRVEGQGVHDDIPHSDYPKWIQHRGMGPIQVQNAEEEAMRVAESDALPEPAEPTYEELAKAELEKELGRPLTDLECLVGPAALLAFKRDKNTLLVFHPDQLKENLARMDDDGATHTYIPVPDPMEAPPVLIESAAAENAHGIDPVELPDVPEAPAGESPLPPLHVVIDKLPVE